jgi:hypothetical protein
MPTNPDSEIQDLANDYLDEDPSILSEAQLNEVGRKYGLSLKQVKEIVKGMKTARDNLDPEEINR